MWKENKQTQLKNKWINKKQQQQQKINKHTTHSTPSHTQNQPAKNWIADYSEVENKKRRNILVWEQGLQKLCQ